MRNLAGVEDCDRHIRDELERAEIEIVEVERDDVHHEVPFTLEGRIGDVRLFRAWTYWSTGGDVPLELAKRMYARPEGKQHIRAAGDCGCSPPEKHVTWRTEDGKSYFKKSELDETIAEWGEDSHLVKVLRAADDVVWVDDPSAVGTPVVTGYDIDTQAGLLLFAMMLKGEVK